MTVGNFFDTRIFGVVVHFKIKKYIENSTFDNTQFVLTLTGLSHDIAFNIKNIDRSLYSLNVKMPIKVPNNPPVTISKPIFTSKVFLNQ